MKPGRENPIPYPGIFESVRDTSLQALVDIPVTFRAKDGIFNLSLIHQRKRRQEPVYYLPGKGGWLHHGGLFVDVGEQQEEPSRGGHAANLLDDFTRVVYVVQGIERADDIEGSVRKWQVFCQGGHIVHGVLACAQAPVFCSQGVNADPQAGRGGPFQAAPRAAANIQDLFTAEDIQLQVEVGGVEIFKMIMGEPALPLQAVFPEGQLGLGFWCSHVGESSNYRFFQLCNWINPSSKKMGSHQGKSG